VPKTAVGRACIRNGGTSYTKGSPVTMFTAGEEFETPGKGGKVE